jgi:hypothetical protein
MPAANPNCRTNFKEKAMKNNEIIEIFGYKVGDDEPNFDGRAVAPHDYLPAFYCIETVQIYVRKRNDDYDCDDFYKIVIYPTIAWRLAGVEDYRKEIDNDDFEKAKKENVHYHLAAEELAAISAKLGDNFDISTISSLADDHACEILWADNPVEEKLAYRLDQKIYEYLDFDEDFEDFAEFYPADVAAARKKEEEFLEKIGG